MSALRERAVAFSDLERAAAHRRTLRGELEAAIERAIEALDRLDGCEDDETEAA